MQEQAMDQDEILFLQSDDGPNINTSAEDMLNRMMNQTFNVNIRGQKVPFDVRDRIFQLSGPV